MRAMPTWSRFWEAKVCGGARACVRWVRRRTVRGMATGPGHGSRGPVRPGQLAAARASRPAPPLKLAL